MHLFMTGATGRSGSFALQYALDQGTHGFPPSHRHHVTALIRSTSRLAPHERLTVVEGSVLSESDMDRAFATSNHPFDAAIQFLDASRKSVNPWSEFIGPVRILPDAAANTARALRKQQPLPSGQKPRLIIMCGRGTGESIKTVPLYLKFMIDHSNLGKTYAEHNAVNAEIEDMCGQDLVWTLPMPVALSNAGVQPVKTFGMTEGGTSQFITRESCARWMVDLAVGKLGTKFDGKRVVLSK
ncbi:hypothetical protein Neosp_012221 [[Neocosmospora] mangrovei]